MNFNKIISCLMRWWNGIFCSEGEKQRKLRERRESFKQRGKCMCVCVCVYVCACACAQWILNKDTLKGKHTPAVLICSVSVFRCHTLLSHLLFSLPLLICLYSTHPEPSRLPPFFFPSPSLRIGDTFISISRSCVVVVVVFRQRF